MRTFTYLVCGTLALCALGRPASASLSYGTLSNFDVVNDTGQPTYGFEIELGGLTTTADVIYTFGGTYERYGNPQVLISAGGVTVRYSATYNAGTWSASTPVAPASFPPTMGHQCWTGGSSSYPNVGCDHFGMALTATPTSTTYHWLVLGSTPGTLAQYGSSVNLPAPVVQVVPAIIPANPPVVNVVAPAPPKEVGQLFGTAVWEKVYTSEQQDAAINLNDLLDGAAALNDSSVETEWMLLQPGLFDQNENNDQMVNGKEAVTRHYEFYAYTGNFDSDHQALCETPSTNALPNPDCGSVLNAALGVYGVGNLIGAQNVGANLAGFGPVAAPEPGSLALLAPAVGWLALRRRRA